MWRFEARVRTIAAESSEVRARAYLCPLEGQLGSRAAAVVGASNPSLIADPAPLNWDAVLRKSLLRASVIHSRPRTR
jgi:hypothetical protein